MCGENELRKKFWVHRWDTNPRPSVHFQKNFEINKDKTLVKVKSIKKGPQGGGGGQIKYHFPAQILPKSHIPAYSFPDFPNPSLS